MHNKLVLECTNSLIEEGMKEAYAACRDNKKKFKTDGVIEKVACGVGKLVRRKNLFNARRKFKNEKESRIIKGKGNQELHKQAVDQLNRDEKIITKRLMRFFATKDHPVSDFRKSTGQERLAIIQKKKDQILKFTKNVLNKTGHRDTSVNRKK